MWTGYLQNGIEVLPGDCVVDVGANIGLFAIRIAMRYPEAQVIACEPIPRFFRFWRPMPKGMEPIGWSPTTSPSGGKRVSWT